MALKKPFLIKPNTQEEAETKLLQVTQILKKLRESSTLWQLHFGSYYKNEMLFWQQKADDFLKQNIVDVDVAENKILID
jgi:hypothetical protein